MSDRYRNRLNKGENGRQVCSVCSKTIPKDIDRISFEYRTQWGYSHKRICSYCIEQLYLELDKDSLEKWKEKMLVDKL